MDRDNFYLLLGLSTDPPEKDNQQIEKAIKNKQTEWSRYRNHPTKAILVQKNIDMIPEIRRIMLNEELREKEAQDLIGLIEKKDKDKFSKLDRHIRIYLSNETVTDKEIARLAELHDLDRNKVLLRIDPVRETISKDIPQTKSIPEAKAEKLSRIDQYLLIRMSRGFVLEKDISRLAKLYAVSEDEIRNRVKCPVIKKAVLNADKPKPLDKSIIKVISDNLHIVSKSTLYEFLGLPENTPLETLQKNSKDKRAKTLKVGKKDALVTASGVLAGHCIAIFKSEESRNAYDISRARSLLGQLHSDINLAQNNGVIIHSYFKTLVNLAAEFGLDNLSAQQYIEEYCEDKEWTIQSSKKIKRFMAVLAAVVIATILIIAATGITLRFIKNKQVKKQFQNVLTMIENKEGLEERETILRTFLGSLDKKSDLVDLVEKKIKEVQKNITHRDLVDKQDFEITLESADSLLKSNGPQKAKTVYKQYLEMHPGGRYINEINRKIADVEQMIDDLAFEGIGSVTPTDYGKRVAACKQYLKDYPSGSHRTPVTQMLTDMSDNYYLYIKEEIAQHEKKKAWDKCLQLSKDFLNTYKNHKKSSEIMGLQYYFQKKIKP